MKYQILTFENNNLDVHAKGLIDVWLISACVELRKKERKRSVLAHLYLGVEKLEIKKTLYFSTQCMNELEDVFYIYVITIFQKAFYEICRRQLLLKLFELKIRLYV